MRIDLTADNPWRPPDWRWQRALAIANADIRAIRRFDDEGVVRATRRARRLLACETPQEEESLALTDPGFYWALHLYRSNDHKGRAEVEARVLADQPVHEIVQRTSLRADAITTYESCFFDVRPRLRQMSYITQIVIGPAMHRGLTDRDTETIWRLYGYLYGPFVVDALVQQAIDPVRALHAGEVKQAFYGDHDGSITRKHAIAARTIPINTFTQVELLHLGRQLREFQHNVGRDQVGGNGNPLMEGMQTILETLPVHVGRRLLPPEGMDGGVINRYDQSATELSTPQLLLAVQGQLPPEFAEPPDLQYPEVQHAQLEQRDAQQPAAGG